MEPQILDQWAEDKWSAESYQSQHVKDISDSWPKFVCPTEYDPLAFEDLRNLNDPASADSLSISSSPLAFELPSPISDFSSLDVDDPFHQNSFIKPWIISTACNNITINPTALSSFPSGENTPAMEIPDLASSSESSGSNSPRNIEQDVETKKPTKRGRKYPSEDCGAKSPRSSPPKPHNVIEKRYRNNLNNKIMSLRDSIPSLCPTNENKDENTMDSDTGEIKKVPKSNKGVILGKAITYIAELERQKEYLTMENARLQLIVNSGLSSYMYASGVQIKGWQGGIC